MKDAPRLIEQGVLSTFPPTSHMGHSDLGTLARHVPTPLPARFAVRIERISTAKPSWTARRRQPRLLPDLRIPAARAAVAAMPSEAWYAADCRLQIRVRRGCRKGTSVRYSEVGDNFKAHLALTATRPKSGRPSPGLVDGNIASDTYCSSPHLRRRYAGSARHRLTPPSDGICPETIPRDYYRDSSVRGSSRPPTRHRKLRQACAAQTSAASASNRRRKPMCGPPSNT